MVKNGSVRMLFILKQEVSVIGQLLLLKQIVNRANSSKFPDTVCGVVNKEQINRYKCQFTYM